MSASKAQAKPAKNARRHRILVPVLVFLGALCLLVSTVSVWIRDVALDESVWADTSTQLLQSENVRNVLSVYIVDQAYLSADAEARLEEALPERLKPLAGPLSAELRGVAYTAVDRALSRPRVQELWRSANRATNKQVVDFIEGDTSRLQSTGGAVVLNLDQIVADVTGRAGIGEGATATAQEHVQPIVILQADQLSTAQNIVKLLRALSFWPLLLALALWAGAVYLAADRRRVALRNIALSLVLVGLLLLVIRRLVGNAVIDNLVQTESVRAAARDVWTVLSALLAQSAVAGIAVGLVAMLGLWLSSPAPRATAARRWFAPVFRDHPLWVHGGLAVVLLLLLLWGPAGSPRRAITLVIVTVLAFVGLELLRRQSVREFPNAVFSGGFNPFRRRVGAADAEAERVESLERLAALHERGALTDKEYEAEKALLAG